MRGFHFFSKTKFAAQRTIHQNVNSLFRKLVWWCPPLIKSSCLFKACVCTNKKLVKVEFINPPSNRGVNNDNDIYTVIFKWVLQGIFINLIGRSSHLRWSLKRGILKDFSKFTAKHLCQSAFFKKVTDLTAKFTAKHLCQSAFFKKVTDLRHFFIEHLLNIYRTFIFLFFFLWWLLLNYQNYISKGLYSKECFILALMLTKIMKRTFKINHLCEKIIMKKNYTLFIKNAEIVISALLGNEMTG